MMARLNGEGGQVSSTDTRGRWDRCGRNYPLDRRSFPDNWQTDDEYDIEWEMMDGVGDIRKGLRY